MNYIKMFIFVNRINFIILGGILMYGIISVLPFVFVFIGIFTVIYIMYMNIFEKRRKMLLIKDLALWNIYIQESI